MTKTTLAICTVFALAIFAAGCSSDTPTSPGSQPQIVNNTDTFEFQVTSMQNYTSTWRYNWTTTGTIVNVDHSSVVNGGSVTLRLLDADGTLVYSRSLAQDGSFTSEPGTTGPWKVEIAAIGCTGTLNFRVEKNQ